MTQFTRYALYFAPVDCALAHLGATWLGWDINAGADATQPLDAAQADFTTTPRKYGFHGTLKPPMRLRPPETAETLIEAVRTLAARHQAFDLTLKLAQLGRFLALTPAPLPPALAHVAAACVTELDRFRAPPTDAELARRRAAKLSPRQEANLVTWGYPHVLEEFRFHMTLTGRLTQAEMAQARDLAAIHFDAALNQQTVFDALSLCGERPDGRFEVIERFSLTLEGSR